MVDAIPVMTPYTTALPLFGVLPTWMDAYDAARIASYQVYEQIYWNIDQTFKLVQRGSQANPIYIPTGRTIVDTTNRYTGAGFAALVDPEFGTPNDRDALKVALRMLFARERFKSKYNAAKRFGLIHGDWGFHIVADPNKVAGSRLSIYALDPGSMFQVTHPDDLDRIQGWHIVNEWVEPGSGDTYLKRQTYSKGPDPYDPDKDDGKIWSSLAIYNLDEWDDPTKAPYVKLQDAAPLPDLITAMPVYHIRNFEEPGNPWGSSEMRGFERLMESINQSMSDEELSLALDGLGVYATTSGPPTDDDGNDVNWRLGPGRVVELDPVENQKVDDIFKRINGVGSVTPYGDHVKQIYDFMMEASNTPEVSRGKVQVAAAESGISLAIQFSPMLAKVAEKDEAISDAMSQFLYDLAFMWFPAYEGQGFNGAIAVPQFGDKLPVNKSQKVAEVLSIVAAGTASQEWGRNELLKYGYVFSADEGAKVDAEVAAKATAADAFATRSAAAMVSGVPAAAPVIGSKPATAKASVNGVPATASN
jgi:hypothetical protein